MTWTAVCRYGDLQVQLGMPYGNWWCGNEAVSPCP